MEKIKLETPQFFPSGFIWNHPTITDAFMIFCILQSFFLCKNVVELARLGSGSRNNFPDTKNLEILEAEEVAKLCLDPGSNLTGGRQQSQGQEEGRFG